MNQVIHIGFSKSASTFLQSIFSSSSEINYIYKSGRFSILDTELSTPELSVDVLNFESDEHIVLPDWHPQLHRVRVTKLETIERVFSTINEKAPEAKIIIVLRNQYSMIVSRYSQYVVGSGGHLSLEAFIDNMLDVSGECFYENYYYQIVLMLERYFGERNTLVLFYEDIKQDSASAIKKISAFSQKDFTNLSPSFRSKRQGLSKNGLEKMRYLNKFLVCNQQPKVDKVKTLIPKIFYNNVVRLLRLIDSKKVEDKIMLPESSKERLLEFFTKDNLELSKYFNRDLQRIGYF